MYASTESDREYARNAGMDRPEQAWIACPSDTWERNPFYSGPAVPHPEADDDDEEEACCGTRVAWPDDEIPY